MTYVLLTQSFGASKSNLPCTITEVSTGLPAVLLGSATGGLISSNGDSYLDGAGSLAVYVEEGKTWQVSVDSGVTPGPVGLLNSAQVVAGAVGVAGVTAGGVLKGVDGSTISGGGGGGATNLTYTPGASSGIVVSDTGTDATLPLADGINAGLISPAGLTKLAGIATGATANSTDVTLLARANHTGTQLASTISDFSTAADARVSAAVVNTLVSTSTSAPLSAAQGKALKDTADALATTVAGKATAAQGVKADAAQPKLGGASAFTTRALAIADDGQNLIVSSTATATINTGLGSFGCAFFGPSVINFTAGAGVTFVDWRASGASFPSCSLVLIGVESYAAVGSKG